MAVTGTITFVLILFICLRLHDFWKCSF